MFEKTRVARYTISNPDFPEMEKILKNHILDYDKKFGLYSVICKWKLNFSNTIINIKLGPWCSVSYGFNQRRFLLLKIEYYERRGFIFTSISEMNYVFIANPRNRTYNNYLQQPKPMIEWKLNLILANNPQLVRMLGNSSHPMIRKHSGQFIDEDDIEN